MDRGLCAGYGWWSRERPPSDALIDIQDLCRGRGDTCLIAAGVSELGAGTNVKVWISEAGPSNDDAPVNEPQPAGSQSTAVSSLSPGFPSAITPHSMFL